MRLLHHSQLTPPSRSFQLPDGEKLDRSMLPELFWCLLPDAVARRCSSCPDEILPNNPNFMENYLRIASDHSKAILNLFNHHYQVLPLSALTAPLSHHHAGA